MLKDFKQTSTRFKHEAEKVHPGYYSVQLTDPNVLVELTATERCGFHRYTFKNGAKAQLALDLSQARAPVPTACRLGRTELNESERHVGAHERVAMTAGSDILIYVLREILSRSGSGCNTKAYSK